MRILVLWNACHGVSAGEDARWVREETAKLRDCNDVSDLTVHAVQSAGLHHPRHWDWCLELRVAAVAAEAVVRDRVCAEFLGDLRLLGTRPVVVVLPEAG